MTAQTEKMKAESKRLTEIYEAHGGKLDPEYVIEDARDPESPWHDRFQWDVEKAAREHWLDVARSIIRTITIEYRTVDASELVPAWVRDVRLASDERGYTPTLEIERDSEHARDSMIAEMGRVVAYLRRALAISDALGLRQEALALLDSADALRSRLELSRPVREKRRNLPPEDRAAA